jgi:threonylcarbamoyladenosine tRNA methylthiotransferase MtaB
VARRAGLLRAEGARRLALHLAGKTGSAGEVLAERGRIGRLPDFTPVRLPPDIPPGEFRQVTIKGHDGRQLVAA